MGLILDTNALSAVVDGDPNIKPIIQRATQVAITVITLGEYRFGILQSGRRAQCERWLDAYLSLYRILEVTEETAKRYAQIRLEMKQAGTPIPSNDVWIAALSREHGFPILSRDRHFDAIAGIRRIGW